MDFIKENLSLIIFGISIISMIIRQRTNETKIKMKIEEMEKDLVELKAQQEQQQKGQNKLFTLLTEIKAQQTLEFKYIKETLSRHDKKLN